MTLSANLGKKPVLQIVVLVVLVAFVAGVYLLPQSTGLNFLTGIFGHHVALTGPSSPQRAGASARRHALAGLPAVLPSHPVTGRVHGQPFAVDHAVFEDGVLRLRRGTGSAGTEVQVQLPGTLWEVPAGKHYRLINAHGAGVPKVVLAWKSDNATAGGTQDFDGKYTLALEFGREAGGALPGKIYLRLPDAAKSTVAGAFSAKLRGFRLVDGKPDLSSDSIDTLEFLALSALLHDDPDKPLQVSAIRGARLTLATPSAQANGYLEIDYQIGATGASAVQRFQFVKEAGVWRVLRTLARDQIDQAHPIIMPGPQDPPGMLLRYLAARQLEATIHKSHPGRGIYVTGFVIGRSDRFRIATCQVDYALGERGRPLATSYLFRHTARGWRLQRALGSHERVDLHSGRIVRG